jgi:ketosteroid isomerase-like protein
MRAVMAGDTTTLMSLWTDDIVSLPPVGPIRSGRAANAAALRGSTQQMKGSEPVDYRLDFREVQIVGSSAFEWGTYKAVARERPTAATMTTTGKVMRILRRYPDGQWKVARTIFTVDP